MYHYDPWIFGMLWEIEHREELGRLARGRLARQITSSKVAPSSESEAQRGPVDLIRYLSSLAGGAWLRLRRSPAKTS